MDNLDEIRKRINSIDAEIAELFEKRMIESRNVANYKIANGLSITDMKREAELIRKNSMMISDDTLREYYVSFEQNLMDLSKAYQKRMMDGMRVAFNGDNDTLALDAISRIFPDARLVSHSSHADAYAACESGDCDAAVLPVENSISGEVGAVTDLMFSGKLYVNQMTDVESPTNGITRFGAFSRVLNTQSGKPASGRRFIIMFTVKNEAGSLAKTLNIIGVHGYNMCNLRSRPMKDLMWNYYFFVELEGDINTREGQSLLQELGTLCDNLKLVGSFSNQR